MRPTNTTDLNISLPALSGSTIARLMRQRRVTIRALAARMNITIKRVRHVRTHGVGGEGFVQDWLEAIMGEARRPDPVMNAAVLARLSRGVSGAASLAIRTPKKGAT